MGEMTQIWRGTEKKKKEGKVVAVMGMKSIYRLGLDVGIGIFLQTKQQPLGIVCSSSILHN